MALEPGTQRVIAWTKAGCPLPGEAAYDEFMRQRDGGTATGVQPATPEAARSEPATPGPREVAGPNADEVVTAAMDAMVRGGKR